MTANELCGRVNNNIYAMLEWLYEIRCSKRVIHDDRNAILMRDSGNRIKVQRIQARIAQCLGIDCFCVLVDCSTKIVRITAIHEAYVDAKFGQCIVEKIIGTTIETCGGDNLITCSGNIENCQRLRCLSGGGRERTNAAFEGCHTTFKSILGGIHDTRIDIAKLLESE